MQLAKHVSQGKISYLNQSEESVSVCENKHYRWLAFTGKNGEQVIQSVMLKRIPWKLTLPHQTALMLPLLFFKPKQIVELGLGGGNIQRYIEHVSKEIIIHSVENNNIVIDCFNQYFNPDDNKVHVIYNDSKQWLQQNNSQYDWYICDVYQQEIQSYENAVNQLEYLTDNISPDTCLSINLPNATDGEVNLLLTILKEVSQHHEISYFHVPNYLNIIIHLIPKEWQTYKKLKRNNQSYLPKNTFSRWKQFWQQGKKTLA